MPRCRIRTTGRWISRSWRIRGLSGTDRDPSLGCGKLTGREMPDFSRDEVRREMLGHVAQRRVGDERDPADVALVVSHEAEVSGHCTETVPAREGWGIDYQATEAAGLCDPGVGQRGKLEEV